MITLTAKIYFDKPLSVNKYSIKDLDLRRKERDDVVFPSWQFTSNGGTLQFFDYDKTIIGYANQGKLQENIDVDVLLTDTTSNQTYTIKGYKVIKWKYDASSFLVTATLGDQLDILQDIYIELPFDLANNEEYNITALQMYDILQEKTVSSGIDMISSSESLFDKATLDHLNDFKIYIPQISASSLWSVWYDFCTAYQLHIYKNSDGRLVCVYRGGD